VFKFNYGEERENKEEILIGYLSQSRPGNVAFISDASSPATAI
jgi:hypothetical protein